MPDQGQVPSAQLLGVMTMLKSIFFAFLILGSLIGSAQTGGADGGGADSVIDNNVRRLLDMVESDEHLYVNLRLVNFDSDISYAFSSTMTDNLSRSIFADKLFDGNIYFANIFNLAMNSGGMTYFGKKMAEWGTPVSPLLWSFVDKDLPEINDEGVIKILNATTKKQLAIQIGRHVFIQRRDFEELSAVDKAALLTHECFLYAVKKVDPGYLKKHGTDAIRTLNRRFIRYLKGFDMSYGYLTGQSEYPAEAVNEAFQQLRIPKN
jgi:hypothetical protein